MKLYSCNDQTYIKSHPRDGLVYVDLCPFEKTQRQRLGIKRECKYGAWSSPGTDHQMMSHVSLNLVDCL